MSDHLTLGIAQGAVTLVNGTIGLLKEARDAAKRSEDSDLKSKLSEVYDSVLELKDATHALQEENSSLRKQIETKLLLSWDTESKFYRAAGDPDPFCPACMDKDGKPVHLWPSLNVNGTDLLGYDCKVCGTYYSIRSRTQAPRPNRGGYDPYSWMGS